MPVPPATPTVVVAVFGTMVKPAAEVMSPNSVKLIAESVFIVMFPELVVFIALAMAVFTLAADAPTPFVAVTLIFPVPVVLIAELASVIYIP